MGIYNDGKIYGLNITTELDEIIIEKIYDDEMTKEQIKDLKNEYTKLSTEQKQNAKYYSVYTCCSTTYGDDYSTYMSWMPVSKEFIDNFLEVKDE
jgi:hypothetical protein